MSEGESRVGGRGAAMMGGQVCRHAQLSLRRAPVVLFFLLLAVFLPVLGVGGETYTVRIQKGVVRGFLHGQTVRFLGIPYATAQRFQSPDTNIPAWTSVKNATTPGPQCSQICQREESQLYCLPK
ncbi:uncharacterized protein LOC106013376, partial [Aplysia californica]|uniref:Uncharacterized protein LOC106013376 n=1 Tax=Aplysia californica TaxID=6500 RepID=A0ABM1AB81_APLCA